MPAAIVTRRVDHINMRAPDPGALLETLAGALELPLMWSLSAFPGLDDVGIPGFEVSGVGVGNTYIEPTRFEPAATPNRTDDGRAFSICMELAAAAEEATSELKRREVVHSPPIPYVAELPKAFNSELARRVRLPRGRQQLWSWIFLGGFCGDPALAAHVFLCRFEAFDAPAIWRASREELRRRDGGPLGVERVREIVVAVSDLTDEIKRWRSLLDPAPLSDGVFALEDGPAIRLVEASGDETLIWEVASFDRARRTLEERGMLGSETETEVRIDPAAMQGLEVCLVERY